MPAPAVRLRKIPEKFARRETGTGHRRLGAYPRTTPTMVTKLIFVLGAVSVTVLALALVATGLLGLVVWVGGSDWARRGSK